VCGSPPYEGVPLAIANSNFDEIIEIPEDKKYKFWVTFMEAMKLSFGSNSHFDF